MDGKPKEEYSSSKPDERHEVVNALPSQVLLNELMEGPRERVRFFNDIISGQDSATELTPKQITGELNSYEQHWLKKYLKTINDEYQALVLSSPETLPQRSELSFHIINQFVMPQWHRALVSPKYPKMDTVDLETAQIQLAMESAGILSTLNSFNQTELPNNELRDIDAMINLLQLSIDGELHGHPNLIAVPHPEIGSEHHRADFLIFEPTEDGAFNKREVQLEEIIDPTLAPGAVAVEKIKNIRINSVFRRPEFQDKAVRNKFFLARKAIMSFNPERNAP